MYVELIIENAGSIHTYRIAPREPPDSMSPSDGKIVITYEFISEGFGI